MIVLEGLISTLDEAGSPHVRPMGPLVPDYQFDRFVLRPYRTSTTYRHLKARGQGVFHVVDDALLLAQATLGILPGDLATFAAGTVEGVVLAGACRWHEFRVTHLEDAEERTTIDAQIVASGRIRDAFGWNRGLHAVVEGAILVTRLHLLPRAEIVEQFDQLAVLVEKTGGPRERAAFLLLRGEVDRTGSDART